MIEGIGIKQTSLSLPAASYKGKAAQGQFSSAMARMDLAKLAPAHSGSSSKSVTRSSSVSSSTKLAAAQAPKAAIQAKVNAEAIKGPIQLMQGSDGSLYGVAENSHVKAESIPNDRPQADETMAPKVNMAQMTDMVEMLKTEKPKVEEVSSYLSDVDVKQIHEMKSRDFDVRMGEMAQLAMAGGYADGFPSYSYQIGPDGISYVVAGSVSLDTSEASSPEETILKMKIVRNAAQSGGSSMLSQVSQRASMTEMRARAQLAEKYNQTLADVSQRKDTVSVN